VTGPPSVSESGVALFATEMGLVTGGKVMDPNHPPVQLSKFEEYRRFDPPLV
jgi:hypothetical protein